MIGADLAALAAAVDLSEGDIADTADRLAGQVQRLAELWQGQGTPEAVALKTLRSIARRHHVELPAKDGFTQRLNRMSDAGWWRRALRKRLRAVEHHAIRCGAVHRHASPYVSAKALRRHERDRRRLTELLDSLEALNVGTGEVIPLADVIEGSQANPAKRRMATMARIKGVETRAREKGHDAFFLTITTPSCMHARHSTGQANERHDGTGPRQAQAHLHRVWRNAMRCMQRQGLAAYGMRTVEPHHDACPHWHVLLFAAPGDSAAILHTLRAYALADSPNEPGAAEHRFRVERIDPAKGSAAGYVAKYVSKSLDGEGVDTDDETGDTGAGAARRIVAWSRLWGIRQFQFFGLPAITPTRELYRHDGEGLGSAGLIAAHHACQANDYAAYLGACEAHRLGFAVHYEERASTRYADELARAIRGLHASAADLSQPLTLTTRTETWRIQPRQAQHDNAAGTGPWTRFNNCAGSLESSTCAPPTGTPSDPQPAGNDGRRRRRPPPPADPRRRPARTTKTTQETSC